MSVTRKLKEWNQIEKTILIIVILMISFILSRVLIYKFVPFRFKTLYHYIQYLDPYILSNDLSRGLFYLHAQPPLFNLFLGLILKISPVGEAEGAFPFIYLIMGLLMVISMYILMRCLKISNQISLPGSFLFMLLPPIIQAERWLFYTYPLCLALVISAIVLYRFIDSPKIIYFILFLAVITGIVLTRSFFHLIFWWLPVMILILLAASSINPARFKLYLGIAICFLIIASSIYIKNYLMFGSFAPSTWQGMNMAAMTSYVEKHELEQIIQSGEVTPLALIPKFSSPDLYYEYYQFQPQSGIKALDDAFKTTGAINGNNMIYIRASKEYQRNTIAILRHYPLRYLKAVFNNIYIFFGLSPYRFFWNYSEWGSIRKDTVLHFLNDVGLILLIPLSLTIIFMTVVFTLINEGIKKYKTGLLTDKTYFFLYTYMVFNLIYVFLVANTMELGEGCFMRIPIDSFLLIGLTLILERKRKTRKDLLT